MISHFMGDSLVIDVPVVGVDDLPFPLAGLALEYHAAPRFYAGDVSVKLSLGDGIELVEPSIARITVPPEALDLVGSWLHSFTIEGGNIGRQTLWAENLNVLPT